MAFSLEGDLVQLRDLTERDVAGLQAVLDHDEVAGWLSLGTGREAAQALIRAALAAADAVPRTDYHLAVTTAHDPDEVIGFARLTLGGTLAGDLEFAIHPDHQGRGYALDAVHTLLDHGFDDLHLHRISAVARRDNVAALKLLKGLGFSPEGRLREHVLAAGAWHDSILSSLLAHERSMTARLARG